MKKTVKAWAVVTTDGYVGDVNNGLCSVAFSKSDAENICIPEEGETVLPCTITYDLPKKRAKK